MSICRSNWFLTSMCLATLGVLPCRAAQNSALAQAHADRAAEHLRHGDLPAAEAELRRAVEQSPQDAEVLGSLGAVLGMRLKLEESNFYLTKALQINPNDLVSRRNLASNQFQLGQLESAEGSLRQILKAKPDDPTARLLMGMVAEELRDYQTAVRFLSSVPDQVRGRPQSIVALGRAYYGTEEEEKARQTLRLLEGHPAGASGIFLGGQAAAQSKDFATAEKMFASIWATYPDTAELGYKLALVQYQANRVAESEATLRKLVEAGHRTTGIYNLLAWCFHRQKKTKDAVGAMDAAIALDPSRDSNYLDLALMLVETGEYSRLPVALAAVKEAAGVAPDSYRAHRLKGLIESKLADSYASINSYRRAVELNPDDPESALGLAVVLRGEGKTPDAEEVFKRSIEQFPRDPRFYLEYGVMLAIFSDPGDKERESQAKALFESALKLDPNLPEAHFQLGSLALKRDDLQGALQHLRNASELRPQESKVHYALSRLYRRLGRSTDASRELRTFEQLKSGEKTASAAAAGSASRQDSASTSTPDEPLKQ